MIVKFAILALCSTGAEANLMGNNIRPVATFSRVSAYSARPQAAIAFFSALPEPRALNDCS